MLSILSNRLQAIGQLLWLRSCRPSPENELHLDAQDPEGLDAGDVVHDLLHAGQHRVGLLLRQRRPQLLALRSGGRVQGLGPG